jgi:GNAT superfamily N-acetyltransferase
MNFDTVKTDLKDIRPLVNEYLGTLTGITDGFFEYHVLQSEFHKIEADGRDAGYFAVYRGDGKRMLTQFYVRKEHIHIAQPIFRETLGRLEAGTAFVPTCDELFLSLCLDHRKDIEMQAYFFDSDPKCSVREPEFGRDCLFAVPEDEYGEMNRKTNGFFPDPVPESSMIYKLTREGEILGYGQIIPLELRSGFWDIGMIVLEPHRQKGAGRSIIMHLSDICRENGRKPVAGCWYYNHNSKRTLESSGLHSSTRLLHITF